MNTDKDEIKPVDTLELLATITLCICFLAVVFSLLYKWVILA